MNFNFFRFLLKILILVGVTYIWQLIWISFASLTCHYTKIEGKRHAYCFLHTDLHVLIIIRITRKCKYHCHYRGYSHLGVCCYCGDNCRTVHRSTEFHIIYGQLTAPFSSRWIYVSAFLIPLRVTREILRTYR